MNATANTAATSSSDTTATARQRPPAHGRFLVAVFGSACACATLPACDDPSDPEALAALARDEAAEDQPPAMSLDLSGAEDAPAAGFASLGLSAVDPSGCGKPSDVCPTPPSPDWCTTYKTLADGAGIPKVYRDIMASKCAKNYNDACYECWDLANYCAQVGTSCTGLQTRCTCMARKLGQL